jgi:hypothetical protein
MALMDHGSFDAPGKHCRLLSSNCLKFASAGRELLEPFLEAEIPQGHFHPLLLKVEEGVKKSSGSKGVLSGFGARQVLRSTVADCLGKIAYCRGKEGGEYRVEDKCRWRMNLMNQLWVQGQ